MAAYGADPEALDALGQLMTRAAQTIDQIGSELSARAQYAPWRGAQADHFRQQWHATYFPALRAAHDELVATSNVLTANARDQRTASGAGGGTTTAVGAGSTRDGSGPSLEQLLHDLIFNVIPPTLDLGGQLIDRIAHAGPAWRALGDVLERLGWALGAVKLVADTFGNESFKGFHIGADSFSLLGSTLIMIGTPGLAIPVVDVGAAVVVGVGWIAYGVGAGIDLGIDFWDTGGGREMWHQAEPWVAHQLDKVGTEAWNTVYHGASDVGSGAEHAASGAWHLATGWL